MVYIVMDLEWNQAVAKEKVIQKPFPLHGEIIQIGALKLDDSLRELDQLKLIVKPQHYLRMNSAVKRLTGIRSQDLESGMSFPAAVEAFRTWCGPEYCFLTWGSDDTAMLMDNLKLHGMDCAWIPATYNLQRIFNRQVTGENRQWSLAGAMEKLDIPQENRPHDALNDAINTVSILRKLDLERGIAEYAEELLDKEGDCLRTLKLSGFSSRREVTTDPRLRTATCPVCSQLMEHSAWLDLGRSREITLFRCPEHGEFLAKLRFKRLPDGKFIAKSMLFAADDSARAEYETRSRSREKAAEMP